MKLSILICSLNKRKEMLNRLLDCLNKQKTDEVEIRVLSDDGIISTGQKRNDLLDMAKGDYIVFIDDDDLVSDDYIELILKAIENKPDVVGIHLLMTTNGKNECRTFHSLKYNHWYDEPDPEREGRRMYFRNPNHLNPVKREIALKVKFPDKYKFEDREYSKNILSHLKTEEYINEPIYYYLYTK